MVCRKNKIATNLLLGLFFFLHLGFSLNAETVTWHGTDDDDWNNGANWSTGSVPADGDDIIIDRPAGIAFNPIIEDLHPSNGSTYKANSILITSGDKLTLSSNRNLLIQHIGTSYGMRVEGEFISYGTLEISGTFLNGMQIVSGGAAEIYGTTFLLDCGRNGIFVEGELFIGIDNSGPFPSAPTIYIYQIEDDGIFINSSGVVEIDDATIEIGLGLFDDLDTPNVTNGIYNKNVFDHLSGTIKIKNASQSGFVSEEADTKLRSGTCAVSEVDLNGIRADGGDFTVYPAMEVDVFEIAFSGFHIVNGCNFVHNGVSHVGINGPIYNNGIWVSDVDSELKNSGTLNITDTGFDGIVLFNSPLLTNYGTINIGQSTGTSRAGILMENSGTMINDGGVINIDDVELGAIYHSTQDTETVTSYNKNGGLINLHLNSPQEYGTSCLTLFDLSKFVNESCSKIVTGPTTNINEPDELTNLGTIVDYSSDNSSIFENSGTIYNLNGGSYSYAIGGIEAEVLTVLDVTWDPCIDNIWGKPGNWSSILPKEDSDAIIPQTSNDPILNSEETIKSLIVDANAILTVNNSLKIEESDINGLIVDGTVLVNGQLTVNDAIENGAVINGNIEVEAEE